MRRNGREREIFEKIENKFQAPTNEPHADPTPCAFDARAPREWIRVDRLGVDRLVEVGDGTGWDEHEDGTGTRRRRRNRRRGWHRMTSERRTLRYPLAGEGT
jgi:hypothetical protein